MVNPTAGIVIMFRSAMARANCQVHTQTKTVIRKPASGLNLAMIASARTGMAVLVC